MSEKYDLAILGHGSAAFAAAIKANELGIKSAFIGKNATKGTVIGGTCVNVGCVPSKNLITVASAYEQCTESSFPDMFHADGKHLHMFDFNKAIQDKDALVSEYRNEKYSEVLENLENVEYLEEQAQFVSKDEVKAGNRTITADKFVIATGARASLPNVDGIKDVEYLTNEEALSLSEQPESMIVVGGRSLGLEFAQLYAQVGTKVTLIQRSGRILPEGEPEISEALQRYLQEDGIEIQTGAELLRVQQNAKRKTVSVRINGNEKELTAEEVLFATGRKPNTENESGKCRRRC